MFIMFLSLLLSCTEVNRDSKIEQSYDDSYFNFVLVDNNNLYDVSFFEKRVQKKGNWSFIPDVIVCEGTIISKARINNALGYWKKLGYVFGNIINTKCTYKSQYTGAIYIMEPRQGFDFSAISNTYTVYRVEEDKSKHIIGAWIEIPDSAIKTERVLEHEIGHALGFQHTIQKYHMMNKTHRYGGHDSSGLEFKNHKK